MDSRNSIIYGSPFPNHAKKDLKKAIGRNHSPVWWESPERGGCGRRRRRGTADRNGAPGRGRRGGALAIWILGTEAAPGAQDSRSR